MKGCAKARMEKAMICDSCDFSEDSFLCKERLRADSRRKIEIVKYRWAKE